jgi:hypothetical protein
MFRCCKKAICALALMLPLSAMAEVIHWEVFNTEEGTEVMGENFMLSGGFDFNTVTGLISNITVKTSADGCIACNDYAGGSFGQTYLLPSGEGGVQFMEEYGPMDGTLGREHFLQLSGSRIFGNTFPFDVSQPGSFYDIDIDHRGLILLDDPLDPDVSENVGCADCAYAIGTLVPIPEPETYALMLSGLGLLGWRIRHKAKAQSITS